MFDLLFNRASIWVLGPGLFLALCIATEAGFGAQQWLDRRWSAGNDRGGQDKGGGAGQILGVTLGLMSLLLSFTFSIANNHYDARRSLVLAEANAIGTAYQRAELLEEPLRSALTGQLRTYTQVRIAFYEAENDEAKLADVEQRTNALQSQLWATTGQVLHSVPNKDLSAALIEAMNHMFDQTPARKIALAAHIPVAVLFSLIILLLASGAMLGAVLGEQGRRHLLLTLMLLALLSFALTLIIDIDRPRQHHVRINQGPLLELRAALQSALAEP